MIIQDAGQIYEYWCYGEPPPPMYVCLAAGDYWIVWNKAPETTR